MAASVAMACAPIQGSIRVCSPTTATCTDSETGTQGNGPAGSTVKVWASHLKPKSSGARYALFMGPLDCHSNTNILKSPPGDELSAMRTNKYGDLDRDLAVSGVQPYKAVLPSAPVPGEYSWEICARETAPVVNGSVTRHPQRFTVVVV